MSGRPSPAKPWEVRSGTSGATTSSPGDNLPKPWERPATEGTITPTSNAIIPTSDNTTIGGVQQPARPWERSTALTNSYGTGSMYSRPGYGGSYSNYGTGYGTGYNTMFNGGYNSMYGGGYGSYGMGGYGGGYNSMYGGMYGRPGMYGGMYGGPPMMMGGGPWDPNDPHGPPQPPSAWQTMLHTISGVVHFFGRLSFLVDENAHAVHFFITALLQLLDRFGSLYGELARFVLRLLGFKPKDKVVKIDQQQQHNTAVNRGFRPPGMPQSSLNGGQQGGGWDNVWTRKNS